MNTTRTLLAASLMLPSLSAYALTDTEINLNVEHSVGGISTFDRKKYITLHSALTENDWVGEEDKLNYILRDLDVYLGRDNGGISYYAKQATEDPARPGFVDPAWMTATGGWVRETVYGTNKSAFHQYEDKVDMMIGGQVHPFWPGFHNNVNGWEFGSSEAVGEYMGLYLNEFYRNDGETADKGHPRPQYLEVLNEPLYELNDEGIDDPLAVFEFHNDVAEAIRSVNPNVQIGGYTTAFPIFEEREFSRWEERMKLFMDTSGDYLDYFSIHLYDFNKKWNSEQFIFDGPNYFKGGRVEATMDMMEQYSVITTGEVKPFLISEYGGRDLSLESETWSPLRDWHTVKAFSPMMLQFMEKPDRIIKSIPFTLIKAEWDGNEGRDYPWRLMRHNDELAGETGNEYVFSDLVKFFELWSNVNGTRVESRSSNPNVLIDTYVDGDVAYVILSNLANTTESVYLNLFGDDGRTVTSTLIKQLHLVDNRATLDETTYDETPSNFVLDPEATAIVEYHFDSDVALAETATETKFYADSYLQTITANQSIDFTLAGVSTSSHGEAVLRIGLGRSVGASLQPQVFFNGTEVAAPNTISGDDQSKRDNFFGMLEIPIANDLVTETNTVAITFNDDGGHVSSVALDVLGFSSDIRDKDAAVNAVAVSPETAIIAVGDNLQLSAQAIPFFATNKALSYDSSDTSIASVDSNGLVTSYTAGTVVITVTSVDGSHTASSTITVEEPVAASLGFDSTDKYTAGSFTIGDTMEISTVFEAGTGLSIADTHGGIQYMLRELTSAWAPVNDVIVRDGSVIGQQRGTSTVNLPTAGLTATANLPEGNFYFLFVRFANSEGIEQTAAAFPINLEAPAVAPGLVFDANSYTAQTYYSGETLPVSVRFEAGSGHTVTDQWNGITYRLRELTGDFSTVVNDYVITDDTVIGQQSGTSSVELPLDGVTPSADLPDDNFYFLFIHFSSTDGAEYNTVAFPITVEGELAADPSIDVDDYSKYITTTYYTGQDLAVTVDFEAGTDNTVTDEFGGIQYMFRHMRADWSVVSDIIVNDDSVVGERNGQSIVNIPLNGVVPNAELEEGDFYFLFIRFASSNGSSYDIGVFPINIDVDPADYVPSLSVDDPAIYLGTHYLQGGELSLTANFNAGYGKTITDGVGGIQYFLRELSPAWAVVNDYIIYDDSVIGQTQGSSTVNWSLDGVTPNTQLADGNFYFIFAQFTNSEGETGAIAGLTGITILADFDRDGLPDDIDMDDDNDSVADANDAFPYDAAESSDFDGDLIGDNADTDDDNDGVDDINDAFPYDTSETADFDLDGIGNNADTDDDNDGVADVDDLFPFDASEISDFDMDGQGDNADRDDDNDGVEDALDVHLEVVSGIVYILDVPTGLGNRVNSVGLPLNVEINQAAATCLEARKFDQCMHEAMRNMRKAGSLHQHEVNYLRTLLPQVTVN